MENRTNVGLSSKKSPHSLKFYEITSKERISIAFLSIIAEWIVILSVLHLISADQLIAAIAFTSPDPSASFATVKNETPIYTISLPILTLVNYLFVPKILEKLFLSSAERKSFAERCNLISPLIVVEVLGLISLYGPLFFIQAFSADRILISLIVAQIMLIINYKLTAFFHKK